MDVHPFSLEDEVCQVAWSTLLLSSPQRNPYAMLEYARALQQYAGYTIECFGVYQGKHLVGGVLLPLQKKGPYQRVVIPPFMQYSSLIFDTFPKASDIHARRSTMDVLLRTIQERYPALYLALHPSIRDVRPLQWEQWEVQPRYTYTIALKDRERMLIDWSAGTRRTFLKHEKAFEIIEAPWAAETIVTLCKNSYERHKCSFPIAPHTLQHIANHLLDLNLARAFLALSLPDEEPQAGVILLHDRKTLHYWIAGSIPGPAMTVLLGTVWPRLYAEAFEKFDFVGANTPSIAEFKRRFGATLVPYFIASRVNRTELKVLSALRTRK